MLIFDIETVAHPDVKKWVEPKNPPSNWKDPAKIAVFKNKSMEEQITKAALDPHTGLVRAIGTRVRGPDSILLAPEDMTEKELLEHFWGEFEEQVGWSCGFNTINFDFPYLLARSMEHKVAVPLRPDLRRYQSNGPTYDLFAILNQWSGGHGLKWLCNRYDIKTKHPDVDGSMVADMEPDMLREYLTDDLDRTSALWDLMKGVYFD